MPEDDASLLPPANPEADDPRPVLVVPDSRGRLKSWHYLRNLPLWKDFIALCTARTPQEHLHYLERKGVHIIMAGEDKVDFR